MKFVPLLDRSTRKADSLLELSVQVRETVVALVADAVREVGAAGALVGCLQLAATLQDTEGAVIVTIFPDAAEKYLSERFWDEA